MSMRISDLRPFVSTDRKVVLTIDGGTEKTGFLAIDSRPVEEPDGSSRNKTVLLIKGNRGRPATVFPTVVSDIKWEPTTTPGEVVAAATKEGGKGKKTHRVLPVRKSSETATKAARRRRGGSTDSSGGHIAQAAIDDPTKCSSCSTPNPGLLTEDGDDLLCDSCLATKRGTASAPKAQGKRTKRVAAIPLSGGVSASVTYREKDGGKPKSDVAVFSTWEEALDWLREQYTSKNVITGNLFSISTSATAE